MQKNKTFSIKIGRNQCDSDEICVKGAKRPNQWETKDNLNYLNFKFTSKELDQETGLYYFGARYFEPQISRWMSPDPALEKYLPIPPINDKAKKYNKKLPNGGVFNPINLNLYHYSNNNPIKYIDPDGLKPRTYKISNKLYIFAPDISTIEGAIDSLAGIIPFVGGAIRDFIAKSCGFRTIKGKDIYSNIKNISSFTSNLISQAEHLSKISSLTKGISNSLKTIEKIAAVVSAIILAIDTGVSLSKIKEVGLDTLISKTLGSELVSYSHEGVATLYAYAKFRMQELIENGDVSYKVDEVGVLTDYKFDPKAMDNLKKELKTVQDIMYKMNKKEK